VNRPMFALAVATCALTVFDAHADSGMKPGLYEMKLLKTVTDGQDQSDQMSSMNAMMQEKLKSMPPEHRAQMEAMMKQRGVAMGGQGSLRMCLTAEMAKRDVPVVDKDGACEATNVKRDGKHMTYDLDCKSHGSTMTGKGESTMSGDTLTHKGDITTKSGSETHRIQTEIEFKYVGSDCGDVKPCVRRRE